MLAEATAVDVAAKRVVLADGLVDYDILIMATGATHAYFGHDEWAEHSTGLEEPEGRAAHPAAGADGVRDRRARAGRRAATGVDDLRDRRRRADGRRAGRHAGRGLASDAARDFRHINTASARVILVEAGPARAVRLHRRPVRGRAEAAREAGRVGLDRGPGDRDRRRRRLHRRRAGPRAHGALGRGRRRARRWPGRSASRSTAPAACWSSPS